MKRQQLLFLHIFYWSVYIIGSIIVPYFLFENDKLIWDITFLITSVICFYFNYFFVVPQFFDVNNLYKTICSSDERNKTTLNRQFERDRIHMDQLIADLYQLGKLDAKIPSIEELYRNL